jgi:hypothetical protein
MMGVIRLQMERFQRVHVRRVREGQHSHYMARAVLHITCLLLGDLFGRHFEKLAGGYFCLAAVKRTVFIGTEHG